MSIGILPQGNILPSDNSHSVQLMPLYGLEKGSPVVSVPVVGEIELKSLSGFQEIMDEISDVALDLLEELTKPGRYKKGVVAEKIGVEGSQISRYLAGKKDGSDSRRPSLLTSLKIIAVAADLLSGDENRSKYALLPELIMLLKKEPDFVMDILAIFETPDLFQSVKKLVANLYPPGGRRTPKSKG